MTGAITLSRWPFGAPLDLRPADAEEVPLSAEEVMQGVEEGLIAPGPRAAKMVLQQARVIASARVAEAA